MGNQQSSRTTMSQITRTGKKKKKYGIKIHSGWDQTMGGLEKSSSFTRNPIRISCNGTLLLKAELLCYHAS